MIDILVVEDKASNSIHTAIYAGAGLAYDATNPIGVSCRIVMLDSKSVPETYRYYVVRPGTNTSTQATTIKCYYKTSGYTEEPYSYAGQTSTWTATYTNFLNEALWERRGIDCYEASCGFEINGKTVTRTENLQYEYSIYSERSYFEITPEEIGRTVDQMSVVLTDIFG